MPIIEQQQFDTLMQVATTAPYFTAYPIIVMLMGLKSAGVCVAEKISSVSGELDLQNFTTEHASWNSSLRQGEKGAFKVSYDYSTLKDIALKQRPQMLPYTDTITAQQPLPPVPTYDELVKVRKIIFDHITSKLNAAGVTLTAPLTYAVEGNKEIITVTFQAGVLPVAIIWLIVAGIAGLCTLSLIISVAIVFYRLKEMDISAAITRATTNTQSSVTQQTATTQAALTAISALPPAQQVEALQNLINSQQQYAIQLEETASESTDAGITGIFKQPLMVIAVMAGIGILVFAFFKGRS